MKLLIQNGEKYLDRLNRGVVYTQYILLLLGSHVYVCMSGCMHRCMFMCIYFGAQCIWKLIFIQIITIIFYTDTYGEFKLEVSNHM